MTNKKNFRNNNLSVQRREFLKLGFGITAAGLLVPQCFVTPHKALGAAGGSSGNGGKGKFILHITAESWDGWHSGLLMPSQTGVFPTGVFKANVNMMSPNPNCNDHATVGVHVLNGYTKILEPICRNAFFGTITPETLSHETASVITCTGSDVMGVAGMPSWAMGFAHRMASVSGAPTGFIVEPDGNYHSQRGHDAVKATPVRVNNVGEFKKSRLDSVNVEGTASNHKKMIEGFAKSHPLGVGGKAWGTAAAEYSKIVGTLSTPQAVDPSSPLMAGIKGSINKEAVDRIISGMDDKDGVFQNWDNAPLVERLQLAAALIETGEASGMAFDYFKFEDLHYGGSSVQTARTGAAFFAHLRCFWEWVLSKGLQNNVLVLVTQQFSRSPWITEPDLSSRVVFKGSNVNIASPGTDHWLIGGVFALHGSFSQPAKLGGVDNSNMAVGGSDLKGTILPGSAHTIKQVAGSLMMRCFPEEFPTDLEVHNTWFNFRISDVIPHLAKA
jgi:hypothetical protein